MEKGFEWAGGRGLGPKKPPMGACGFSWQWRARFWGVLSQHTPRQRVGSSTTPSMCVVRLPLASSIVVPYLHGLWSPALQGNPFDHEVCRRAGVGSCDSIIIGE